MLHGDSSSLSILLHWSSSKAETWSLLKPHSVTWQLLLILLIGFSAYCQLGLWPEHTSTVAFPCGWWQDSQSKDPERANESWIALYDLSLEVILSRFHHSHHLDAQERASNPTSWWSVYTHCESVEDGGTCWWDHLCKIEGMSLRLFPPAAHTACARVRGFLRYPTHIHGLLQPRVWPWRTPSTSPFPWLWDTLEVVRCYLVFFNEICRALRIMCQKFWPCLQWQC